MHAYVLCLKRNAGNDAQGTFKFKHEPKLRDESGAKSVARGVARHEVALRFAHAEAKQFMPAPSM